MIARAIDVSRRTNGIFDITVGAFKGLWKFDQDMDGTLPDPADVKKRLSVIGWKHVKLDSKAKTVFLDKKGMSITLGGIAKGYAVDKCVALLQREGFVNFMVQAGGDMYVAGKKGADPWMVGIRDPRGPEGSMFALAPIDRPLVLDLRRLRARVRQPEGQPPLPPHPRSTHRPARARVALGDGPREGRVHRRRVVQGHVHPRLEGRDAADQAREARGLRGRVGRRPEHDPHDQGDSSVSSGS